MSPAKKVFQGKGRYEIGTAPFSYIMRKRIRHENGDDYAFPSLAEKKLVKIMDVISEGAGFDGDWCLKVDDTCRNCLERHMAAKYMNPQRRCEVYGDVRAFAEKDAGAVSKIIIDYLNSGVLEEIAHSMDYGHQHREEGVMGRLRENEKDYALFWNIANLENFTDKNTVDLGE